MQVWLYLYLVAIPDIHRQTERQTQTYYRHKHRKTVRHTDGERYRKKSAIFIRRDLQLSIKINFSVEFLSFAIVVQNTPTNAQHSTVPHTHSHIYMYLCKHAERYPYRQKHAGLNTSNYTYISTWTPDRRKQNDSVMLFLFVERKTTAHTDALIYVSVLLSG